MLKFVLSIFLCLAAPCYGADRIIESFANPGAQYSLVTSSDYPQSSNKTLSWVSDGHGSKGALKIDYCFGPRAATYYDYTFRYCAWEKDLSHFSGNDFGVAFYAKGRTGTVVMVQVVDSTGQVFENLYDLSRAGWQQIKWIFNTDVSSTSLSGKFKDGANDGYVHTPIKRIRIGANGWANAPGYFLVDDLSLITGLPDKEVVNIDLAADRGPVTYRAAGFLHSISTTEPVDKYILPLKPKLFRLRPIAWDKEGKTGWAVVPRLKKMNAKVQIVISDAWALSPHTNWPGDNGDWTDLSRIITDLVNYAKTNNLSVEWDIWNEPDFGGAGAFWERSQEQLFDTWMFAYRKIRELDPDAFIVGPSVSNFNRQYLEDFLLFAKKNSVLPDCLAWHEMSFVQESFKLIPEHVRYIRGFMSANGIDIRNIAINEYLGPHLQTNPGVHAQTFAALEKAGVYAACHSGWADKNSTVNCMLQNLDGMLTYPELEPRPAWWVHKGYADITGRLVSVEPSLSVDGVAGKDSKTKVLRAVLGRNAGVIKAVAVRLKNIDSSFCGAGSVHVVAQRIPDMGYRDLVLNLKSTKAGGMGERTRDSAWNALPNPIVTIDKNYKVEKHSLIIDLPDFGATDAYILRISAAR